MSFTSEDEKILKEYISKEKKLKKIAAVNKKYEPLLKAEHEKRLEVIGKIMEEKNKEINSILSE